MRKMAIAIKFIVLFSVVNAITLHAFNEDWSGQWVGSCNANNYNTDNPVAPYQMNLTISEVDSKTLSWSIQYPPQSVRRYQLKQQADILGHYVLDEKNGILIDQFYSDNVLRELYLVNGRFFTGVSIKTGDVLIVEHTSFWSNPLRTTSLEDGSFPVKSFALRDHTKCILNKKKN